MSEVLSMVDVGWCYSCDSYQEDCVCSATEATAEAVEEQAEIESEVAA